MTYAAMNQIDRPLDAGRLLDSGNQMTAAASGSGSLPEAVLRGLRHKCPACGNGRLFRAYLKVADACPDCHEPLHNHRADDAPPYFTIVIVGHIVLPGVLILEQTAAPPEWLHLALWLPLTIILSLALLPPIKGALVGLQWANRMHGFGGDHGCELDDDDVRLNWPSATQDEEPLTQHPQRIP